MLFLVFTSFFKPSSFIIISDDLEEATKIIEEHGINN
jgi:hypothetical protein